jgi:hypothetical protein
MKRDNVGTRASRPIGTSPPWSVCTCRLLSTRTHWPDATLCLRDRRALARWRERTLPLGGRPAHDRQKDQGRPSKLFEDFCEARDCGARGHRRARAAKHDRSGRQKPRIVGITADTSRETTWSCTRRRTRPVDRSSRRYRCETRAGSLHRYGSRTASAVPPDGGSPGERRG